MKKLALHWWILIGMVAGVAFGIAAAQLDVARVQAGDERLWTVVVLDWIKPFGTLFMSLLKMIAVPLVLFSLVAGVASLNDTAKVGRIGGKTIALYLGTTAIAITIGLLVVNLFSPGSGMDDALVEKLQASFADEVSKREAVAKAVQDTSPLAQFFSQVVPTNPFGALSSGAMLQVVFFALMLGIALTKLETKAADHVVKVFQLLSDAIIEMVLMIMKIAPFGVFALISAVIAEMGEDPEQLSELLKSLASYMGCVVLGLFLHGLIVYSSLIKFVAKVPLSKFYRGMIPAQLLAFSSSSSGATLPVTMRCAEKNIGVDEEVSGFVLPLGATINMDGTGLYQGVAAVFIANALNHDLTLGDQLNIVLMATMASIGTAAVPGVGIVMLILVLDQIGIGGAGIALILGVDRPLDMCRTVLNVTGDASVATVVASSEGLLGAPADHPDGAGDVDDPRPDDAPDDPPEDEPGHA